MEKGIIKNVSIEDFKTNENFVNGDKQFRECPLQQRNGEAELLSSDFLFGRQHSVGYE